VNRPTPGERKRRKKKATVNSHQPNERKFALCKTKKKTLYHTMDIKMKMRMNLWRKTEE